METCTNTCEHLLSHKGCPPLNGLDRNIQPSGISSWQRKKISLVTISHNLAKKFLKKFKDVLSHHQIIGENMCNLNLNSYWSVRCCMLNNRWTLLMDDLGSPGLKKKLFFIFRKQICLLGHFLWFLVPFLKFSFKFGYIPLQIFYNNCMFTCKVTLVLCVLDQ